MKDAGFFAALGMTEWAWCGDSLTRGLVPIVAQERASGDFAHDISPQKIAIGVFALDLALLIMEEDASIWLNQARSLVDAFHPAGSAVLIAGRTIDEDDIPGGFPEVGGEIHCEAFGAIDQLHPVLQPGAVID